MFRSATGRTGARRERAYLHSLIGVDCFRSDGCSDKAENDRAMLPMGRHETPGHRSELPRECMISCTARVEGGLPGAFSFELLQPLRELIVRINLAGSLGSCEFRDQIIQLRLKLLQGFR